MLPSMQIGIEMSDVLHGVLVTGRWWNKFAREAMQEVLKTHPSVLDAAVVGLPDERFGEAITALVEARPGQSIDAQTLIAHVRSTLAPYKSPKSVITVATIGRAPNGKLDYKRLKQEAIDSLKA